MEQEPQSVVKAMNSIEKDKWTEAMKKEMDSIYSNDVWDLVKPLKDHKVIGSKWVFKRKTNADGSLERYKARLVAQGFSQQLGLDYDETFSPVIRFESLRGLIVIAVQKDLKLHQLDVTAAFLNGVLQEDVYMEQPEGFVVEGKESLVCKLKHSLYGLKQSPRCWNSALDTHLKSIGFVQSSNDPCIYTATEGEPFIMGVYVDDIVLASNSSEKVQEMKDALAQKITIRDLGELKYFLGVQITQDASKNQVWIGQPTFTELLLSKYGLSEAKPTKTPVNVGSKLLKATEDSELADQRLYQSAVGSLLYLATRTRPDIAYAVNNVARFCSKPSKEHWVAVKRIFRYLKSTINFSLVYCKDNTGLVGYSDADWGVDHNDFKSTTGYLFKIGNTAVSWKSKKQSCVALST